jgi:hypothetical protein
MSVFTSERAQRVIIADDMRAMGLNQPELWGIIATNTQHGEIVLDQSTLAAYELGKSAASGIAFEQAELNGLKHLLLHPAFDIGETAVLLQQSKERLTA